MVYNNWIRLTFSISIVLEIAFLLSPPSFNIKRIYGVSLKSNWKKKKNKQSETKQNDASHLLESNVRTNVCVSLCMRQCIYFLCIHSAMSLLLWLSRSFTVRLWQLGFHLCLHPSSLKIMIVIIVITMTTTTTTNRIINIGFVSNFGVCPLTSNKYISLFYRGERTRLYICSILIAAAAVVVFCQWFVSLQVKEINRQTDEQTRRKWRKARARARERIKVKRSSTKIYKKYAFALIDSEQYRPQCWWSFKPNK